MRKKYFKTTDLYLAAYLVYQCDSLIEMYKPKKWNVVFVFDNTDFLNENLFRYENRINFDFWDFSDEIYNLRTAIEKNLS